ncbi:hypothetical protein ACFY0N_16540 [Streptomyces vinaceus]|uniref:hypothetical protein n=1 Tax=Streptomyces vinaceus TaxID=1960 RepID=UPI0036BD515B
MLALFDITKGDSSVTVIVTRHFTPGATEEEWAEYLGGNLAQDIDELEEYPHSLPAVLNDALLHLGARCTVDPRAAKLETLGSPGQRASAGVGRVRHRDRG